MDIWPSWLRGNLPSFVVTIMWSSAPEHRTQSFVNQWFSPQLLGELFKKRIAIKIAICHIKHHKES